MIMMHDDDSDRMTETPTLVPCSDIRAVVETPGICTGLVQTSVCKVILLSNLYSFDFSYRRSHVHNCSHMLTTSDGQEPFLTPKTKP